MLFRLPLLLDDSTGIVLTVEQLAAGSILIETKDDNKSQHPVRISNQVSNLNHHHLPSSSSRKGNNFHNSNCHQKKDKVCRVCFSPLIHFLIIARIYEILPERHYKKKKTHQKSLKMYFKKIYDEKKRKEKRPKPVRVPTQASNHGLKNRKSSSNYARKNDNFNLNASETFIYFFLKKSPPYLISGICIIITLGGGTLPELLMRNS